jgi:O-antigen ligase
MRLDAVQSSLVLIGAATFALIVTLVLALLGLKYALILGPGLCAMAVLARDPFLPFLLLILSIPLDAVANLLFVGLPIEATQALVAATLGAVLLNAAAEPRSTRLGPNEISLRLAVLFAIASLISFLVGEHSDLAVRFILRLLGMYLIVYLAIRVISRMVQIEVVLMSLVAATLFSGLTLIAESFFGIRLFSTAAAAVTAQFGDIARSSGASDYNPTTAAAMTLTGMLIALVLFVEHPKWRWLTGPTVVVGAVAVVLSFARSSALCLGLLAPMLAWRYRKREWFALGAVLVLLTMVCAIPFIPDAYWERLQTLTSWPPVDRTLWRRLGYNLIGLQVLLDNPILGVGPANFPLHYVDTDFRFYPGRTLLPRHLHNMYLGIAVEFGLIGLALFLGLIGYLLSELRKAMKSATDAATRCFAAALLFGFISWLITSVFLPNQFNKFTWALIGISAALVRVARLETNAQASTAGSPIAGSTALGNRTIGNNGG